MIALHQNVKIALHILVECNHLAQTRNDIFGRCGVVEFQPELVLNLFKDSEFYSKF